ncbi:MAG: hypothetical protein K9N47_18885 [Prosthecobacter sp.]|uniref:hypothetical protein n=1 Tax=Prosthecobacter sp. TaxID=1965333 RepID=UPI0025D77E11|nr:hypothetical protein [Prosthecobacter sp.]MCF7788196.1 hypothetical protein [Prosthecobacter sp.]
MTKDHGNLPRTFHGVRCEAAGKKSRWMLCSLIYCRASQNFKKYDPRMKVMMHADMIENAACVRVAELPEPVKNQRSQHGLPCRAQFFAGSVDVSLRSIDAASEGNTALGRALSQNESL